MKKHKKEEKSSILNISGSERLLLDKVGAEIFSLDDVKKLVGWKKEKIYQTMHSMKKKNLVLKLGNEKFALNFPKKPGIEGIISYIVWPSYLSFWTALSYYKFTEQIPRSYILVTTKANRHLEIDETKIIFVKLSKSRFFGYRKIGELVIAEKEKAVIDSILFPRYSGGLSEIFKCLINSWKELDKEKLVEYAIRVNNKSLNKRLGYLIELAKLDIEKCLVEKLRKNIGKGFSKLDAEREKSGDYNNEWGLIINMTKEELLKS